MKKLLLAVLCVPSLYAMEENAGQMFLFQVPHIPYGPAKKVFEGKVRQEGERCVYDTLTHHYLRKHSLRPNEQGIVIPHDTLQVEVRKEGHVEQFPGSSSAIIRRERALDEAGNVCSDKKIRTAISNPDEMLSVFKSLAYKPLVTLTTKREGYDLIHDGQAYYIAFEQVLLPEASGWQFFYKVALVDVDVSGDRVLSAPFYKASKDAEDFDPRNTEEGRSMLRKLLVSFGIRRIKIFSRGYLDIALNPNKLYHYESLDE